MLPLEVRTVLETTTVASWFELPDPLGAGTQDVPVSTGLSAQLIVLLVAGAGSSFAFLHEAMETPQHTTRQRKMIPFRPDCVTDDPLSLETAHNIVTSFARERSVSSLKT
jgi:hypothetical protein